MRAAVSLRTLTLEECEQVRLWRNAPDVLPMLRTKEPLTAEQQAAFYRDVVCNPTAPHRYYALDGQWQCEDCNGRGQVLDAPLDVLAGSPYWETCRECDGAGRSRRFIGMGGLTYLDRVPGEGEISLILGPAFRGRGLGTHAVDALLDEAFGRLGLHAVVGECFHASPALGFWLQQIERRGPQIDASTDERSLFWRWERR